MSNKGLATVLNDDEVKFENEFEVKEKEDKLAKRRQKYIKIMENYNSGDEFKKKKAVEDIISSLSMYVYSVIAKYFPSYTKHTDDLYQEGCLAILKNIANYDPSIAMPTTYFFVHIRDAINTYIINNINNTSRYYGHNIIKIKKAIKYFETNNQDYTNADIAQKTGLSIETVVYTMNIIKTSTEVKYENDEVFENQISMQSQSPEDLLLDTEKRKVILEAIETLNEDEKIIVTYKLGFVGECLSYKEIGEKINLSTDKVRKKFQMALIKIKNKTSFKKYFGNNELTEEERMLEDAQVSFIDGDLSEDIISELEELEIDLSNII